MTNMARQAFTLIELLVVISIIALLIGILLPALGTARSTAYSIVDQTQLRSIAQAQAVYMLSNEEYFAGPNTSGWGDAAGFDIDNEPYLRNTSSTAPVQTMDFISPILGEELNFSSNRAERFANILNDFADPSVRIFNDTVYPLGDPDSDFNEFQKIQNEGRGYKQASYLSPFAMHAWPKPQFIFRNGTAINQPQDWGRRYGGIPYNWSFDDPVGHPGYNDPDLRETKYRPRSDRVGPTLSNKVIVMNGTRYLDGDQVLDFDPSYSPRFYGAFTSDSPQRTESVSYGSQAVGGSLAAQLSFRHIGESMNMGFFDGHVENASREKVMRRVDWFHPTGMKITNLRNLDPISRTEWQLNERIP